MNDLISVIIPIYNREAYLHDCMKSLLAQSHQNLEIILIDDGSTDCTPEICREYAATDSRIKYLQGAHAGVSAARNLGLDAATGTYVFFVDSDDAIHPLLLETLVCGMQQHNAAMGGTRVVNVPDSKWLALETLIHRHPGPGNLDYHDASASLQSIFKGGSPLNVIGGVMMRRDLVSQTRFRSDIFIGEDFYYIYENLIKGADAVFLQEKWYYCRIHGSNSTANYSYDGFWTRFLRRRLVWQNEEAAGRIANANVEKHSVFMAYLTCVQKNQMSKSDRKKMCDVMKHHRKEILPALNFPRKMRFYLTVYLPVTHLIYCRILSWLKK